MREPEIPQISDAEADEVLAGRRPEGRDDLGRVADAMAWLRIQSQTADPPQIRPELRERLTVPLAGGVWRTRRAARASVLSLAAAATIVLGLLVSGSQGMLPTPVQTIVADAGDAVGLAFPRPPADPDVLSGPGGAEWSTPDPDAGRGTGDGESAADEGASGDTSGDELTAAEDPGLGEGAAGRVCEKWSRDWSRDDRSGDWDRSDWDRSDWRDDESDRDGDRGDWPDTDRDRDDWEPDEGSSDGRAGSAWRTGRSSDGPSAAFDRGVDPEQLGRDANWAGRSRGGDGVSGPDGDSWPRLWCEQAGAAGH
ncbi:MAG: hypothetical protein ACLFXM_16710 [Acidimicrobiia bacterium]